jgi:hypothetical protein
VACATASPTSVASVMVQETATTRRTEEANYRATTSRVEDTDAPAVDARMT